jgi:hypothetical protein
MSDQSKDYTSQRDWARAFCQEEVKFYKELHEHDKKSNISLRLQNEKLREALEKVSEAYPASMASHGFTGTVGDIAREALKECSNE